MLKVLTKYDILLLILLIIAGLTLSLMASFGATRGTKALVKVNGEIYGTYDLSKDQEVSIKENGHQNKFSITDGQVQMTEADCKNQLCVHQGVIHTTGQTIVCLPNRVLIEIEGGEGYDAVSQ